MSQVDIPNARVRVCIIGDEGGQPYKKGHLTVTPWDLTFTLGGWFTGRIEILREEIAGVIYTWKPMLFGQPYMSLCTVDYRFVFRIPSWEDTMAARDLLTTDVARHRWTGMSG